MNWRKEFAKIHTQHLYSIPFNHLRLDPSGQKFDFDKESLTPILKSIQANQLKQVEQIKPSLLCVLTNSGDLYMINS